MTEQHSSPHQIFSFDHSMKTNQGPSQVTPDLGLYRNQVLVWFDATILKNNSCSFMFVNPALGRNEILLVFQWFPDSNKAVLEDGCCISKDEINSAGNDTASVELAAADKKKESN
ncbi:hypothetical protein D5086_031762 [Populus alba]|uniref:Uncharacterized protein n=1 Tax=Populus alba TaxID=43335 RepID=A0ACC4AKE8_POPAL